MEKGDARTHRLNPIEASTKVVDELIRWFLEVVEPPGEGSEGEFGALGGYGGGGKESGSAGDARSGGHGIPALGRGKGRGSGLQIWERFLFFRFNEAGYRAFHRIYASGFP